MSKFCNSCEHFVPMPADPSAPLGTPRQGVCKRNPPTPFVIPLPGGIAGGQPRISVQGIRPPIPENDTCGEHSHAGKTH